MNAQTKTAAKDLAPASEPEISQEIVSKLAHALSQAQAEFLPVLKDKTAKAGSYEYDYADLADLIEAVKGPLAKNGLAHSAHTMFRDGSFLLIMELLHVSGETKQAEWPLPVGKPQDMGSAMTYGRRYTLQAVLGIAAEADDDGAAGGNAPVQTPKKQQAQTPPKQPAPPTNGQANGKTEHRPFALIDHDGVEHTFAKGGEYLDALEKAFQEAPNKLGFWDSNKEHFDGWLVKLIKVGTDKKAIDSFTRVSKEITDTVFLLNSQKGA